VLEHQRLTVESFLRLRELAPTVRWLPVLQGQEDADYVRHMEMYQQAGVCLGKMRLVGLGSVCRLQSDEAITARARLVQSLVPRLHGFGVKATGLRSSGEFFASVDSMAWSLHEAKESMGLKKKAHKIVASVEDLLARRVGGIGAWVVGPHMEVGELRAEAKRRSRAASEQDPAERFRWRLEMAIDENAKSPA